MTGYLLKLIKRFFANDWAKIFSAWKWIYEYVRQYWPQILVYTGLGLFGTVFGLAGSVVSKNLIDAVTGFNTRSIGWAFSLYVGLGVARVLINAFTGKISLLVQNKVSNEIRADIFDQVLQTEWEEMSEYNTGDLLVRLTGDAGSIANSVLSFVPNLVTTLVQFVGTFVIVCYHDPWMALLALAGAPVTFLTSKYRMAKMQQFQKESMQMTSRRMMFNQETFQNIQSVKAFNLVDQFSGRMKKLQQDALDLSLRQYHHQAWSGIIMSLTAQLVSYACYGFAIWRLWQGEISFGTMTLFVSLASNLSGSFSSVVGLVPMAIRAATSADRIMEVIGLPREKNADQSEARAIRREGHRIGAYVKMDHVDFSYLDGREVYTDASFHADPGEIVALIGPSGQGKTTTLRLLLGLLRPWHGIITAGNPGGDSLKISASTRCLFSYVPQGNTMFYGTIAENLRMVRPEATDEELWAVLDEAQAKNFVSRLEDGLDTKVGERGHGFSEGQNQRLSIARALLAHAPILLLDEATSALDVATERRVLRSIMKRDPNRTIIVTAHRPSVLSMCSRVYQIREGRVREVNDEEIRQFLDEF